MIFRRRFHATIDSFGFISVSRHGPELYQMGYYGKGSLSRGIPTWFARHYEGYIPTGIAEQKQQSEFIPLDHDWYNDRVDVEKYVLMPEEAFYLSHQLKILDVYAENQVLRGQALWDYCKSKYQRFASRYVVYSHYRKKGLVVRSGIQYGGDYCKAILT
jgi:hypothetical protein